MIQINASAVILAGGKSARMGKTEDKALLRVSGIRLIEKITRDLEPHFREIIISANRETISTYNFLPYQTVVDKELNQGPLMGILTGLEASNHPVNFVMACDIPEIDFTFIQEMMTFTAQYDIVVPVTGKDKYEPLFAFYHRRLIPKIEDLLDRRIRKIIELFSLCRVKYIPLEKNNWFYNLNTLTDYEKYMAQVKAKVKPHPSSQPEG